MAAEMFRKRTLIVKTAFGSDRCEVLCRVSQCVAGGVDADLDQKLLRGESQDGTKFSFELAGRHGGLSCEVGDT